MSNRERIGQYYLLTKPGIIRGNLLTATAGFSLGSINGFGLLGFFELIGGLSLVIASACIFNNLIDQPLDRKMARTKNRPLLTGSITAGAAKLFGAITLVLGTCLLMFINPLTALLALVGHFMYVIVYAIGKRRTTWSTVIGSISGAIPPVVGYAAASNQLDIIAALLFLALVFWQMPHFYAIAMYRFKDYEAAGLPLLPIVKGNARAKQAIILHTIAFTLTVTALGFFLDSPIVTVVLFLSGVWWLLQGSRLRHLSSETWARSMFRTSLIVILIFCLTLTSYGLSAQ